MTLAQCNPMTFIATRDREAAKAFYGGVLGLTLRHEDYFAVVYDLNGISLRITTVPDHEALRHTVLGWVVEDIAAYVSALLEKGVEFQRVPGLEQDELGIWTVPGGTNRVAWFHDPDGNGLSLTQY